MEDATIDYNVPIWLSDWKFEDSRKNVYTAENVVVKGQNTPLNQLI